MKGDAAEMVNRCFRHQHPEAYDRPEGREPEVPSELRHGRGDSYEIRPALVEERMGNGEVLT